MPYATETARWKETEFSNQLEEAANAFNHLEVEKLCRKLLHHLWSRKSVYPEASAKQDLATLRRKRYFELMARVADAFLRGGSTSFMVRRQYAQALLDLGEVSAAIAVLNHLLQEGEVPARERAEARGLLGRAYKQIYVDAADSTVPIHRAHLLRAVDEYRSVYDESASYLWHGVNAASLLFRAEYDGVDRGDRPAPAEIARAVLDEARDRMNDSTASIWDLATAAEASVVLGRYREAAEHLGRYIASDTADAFEIASTLRQFQEVLRLNPDEPDQGVLLDLLRTGLLERHGGAIELAAGDFSGWGQKLERRRQRLEAVLGEESYVRLSWLLSSLKRANAVARIWRGTRAIGTGFVLRGDRLSSKWKDHQVLVTNNHVIAREPTDPRTILPEEATITFDALHGRGVDQPSFEVKEVLFESPILKLDVTVVRLNKNVDGADELELAKNMPIRDRSVYVIGHPRGEELSFSIHDTKLIDINETRMHYRSPTDPGSSGSPLFDDNWSLLGIHHAGSKEMRTLSDPDAFHAANEGIPLPVILSAVAGEVGA